MKQGQIILVEFPFSNYGDYKIRPALIVSNNKFNKGDDVIALAIGSRKFKSSFTVALLDKDLKAGKLLKPSCVKCSTVLTIDKSLVRKVVAEIDDAKTKEISKKFTSFI